jgi:2-oxoisovalerate dehydrogenase E2 component (dihydrolipoyl transacylase)
MSEYIFKLPDLGEGTVEVEIAEWNVQVGDMVQEEDLIGAMLTDKAAVELSAPVTGRVVSLAGEPGDTVAVGAALIVFSTDNSQPVTEDAAPSSFDIPAADAGQSDNSDAEIVAEPVTPRKILTSPSIRRRAGEAGVDLALVTGSGPRGRIKASDLDDYLASAGSSKPPVSSAELLTAPVTEDPVAETTGTVTEIKVVGLRRMIANRMTEANQEIPHFAYVEEVDVSALESLRKHLNDTKAADDGKLTLLPFIGLALARTLAKFPQCNAHYDRERNVIIRHSAVHLGIATQTPDGLKVPIVRDIGSLSVHRLAAEIRRVSGAARDNTAKREELSGSTITITSLGKLGGIVTTPVINLPEVAIIGVNKAVERPTVVNGQVVIRLMMNLSSSFDHRFVDGYDAAMMIQQLKSLLEQPATLFMD